MAGSRKTACTQKSSREWQAWDMETLRAEISTPYIIPELGLCGTIEDSLHKGRGREAGGGIWNHCTLGFQLPTKSHNWVCVGTSKIPILKGAPGMQVVGYTITTSWDFNSLQTPITRFVED